MCAADDARRREAARRLAEAKLADPPVPNSRAGRVTEALAWRDTHPRTFQRVEADALNLARDGQAVTPASVIPSVRLRPGRRTFTSHREAQRDAQLAAQVVRLLAREHAEVAEAVRKTARGRR